MMKIMIGRLTVDICSNINGHDLRMDGFSETLGTRKYNGDVARYLRDWCADVNVGNIGPTYSARTFVESESGYNIHSNYTFSVHNNVMAIYEDEHERPQYLLWAETVNPVK